MLVRVSHQLRDDDMMMMMMMVVVSRYIPKRGAAAEGGQK